MLKAIKHTYPDHEVAFVSDLHWNHDKPFLYGNRGYASAQEHKDGVIHRWNEVCTNRSIVFHLGDFVFKDPDGAEFRRLLDRLNFRILYLMLGNHNSGLKKVYAERLGLDFPSAAANQMEAYPLTWEFKQDRFVIFLPEYAEAFINGQHIVMCHFPIIAHNRVGHGAWHLCGHSHGTCEITNVDTASGLRLDVGVESFGRPITFGELKMRFADRKVTLFDHHNEATT